MESTADIECCPRFDPEPWDGTTITWSGKRFVTDRVRSLFHVPVNFGSVMRRNVAAIEEAGAKADAMFVLVDEKSPWGADVYIDVAGDVPGARMTTLSGTFASRVFEGPYRHVSKWMKEMSESVRARGESADKIFCIYTTCPKCAKKYGRNDVVLLAKLSSSA